MSYRCWNSYYGHALLAERDSLRLITIQHPLHLHAGRMRKLWYARGLLPVTEDVDGAYRLIASLCGTEG